MEDEFPPICPECKSEDVDWEDKNEYTGGGYSDYWTEFFCNNCGHEWNTEAKTSLF